MSDPRKAISIPEGETLEEHLTKHSGCIYHQILDAIRYQVYLKDESGAFLWVNRAVEDVGPFFRGSYKGKRPKDAFPADPYLVNIVETEERKVRELKEASNLVNEPWILPDRTVKLINRTYRVPLVESGTNDIKGTVSLASLDRSEGEISGRKQVGHLITHDWPKNVLEPLAAHLMSLLYAQSTGDLHRNGEHSRHEETAKELYRVLTADNRSFVPKASFDKLFNGWVTEVTTAMTFLVSYFAQMKEVLGDFHVASSNSQDHIDIDRSGDPWSFREVICEYLTVVCRSFRTEFDLDNQPITADYQLELGMPGATEEPRDVWLYDWVDLIRIVSWQMIRNHCRYSWFQYSETVDDQKSPLFLNWGLSETGNEFILEYWSRAMDNEPLPDHVKADIWYPKGAFDYKPGSGWVAASGEDDSGVALKISRGYGLSYVAASVNLKWGKDWPHVDQWPCFVRDGEIAGIRYNVFVVTLPGQLVEKKAG